MELWDAYDIKRRKLGYCLARCMESELPADCPYRAVVAPNGKLKLHGDEYHLSAHVWFVNSRGELLIQKRSEHKLHLPGVWAACGGAAMAGETTLEAAVRESYEEMGIVVEPSQLLRLLSYTSPERNSHMDVYICRYECDPAELTLQPEEVSRAGWFSIDQITGRVPCDEQFRRYNYLNILYEFIQSHYQWQDAGMTAPGARRNVEELLDVYDIRGERTGRTMVRGSAQPFGEYFWAVHIWLIGSDGRALLQRRSMRCAYKPGLYAATGGLVTAGETPLEAALRETREELGLAIDQSRLFRLCEFVGECYICTVYAVYQDIEPDQLHLQKEEVSAVEFVSADMLRLFSETDNFLVTPYMPMVSSAMRVMERIHHS